MFARFFWGNSQAERRRHWLDWDFMCLAQREGGLDFRSLFYLNKALIAKLWWNFRTSIGSLWCIYMRNTYFRKMHPSFVTSRGASQVWKNMLKIREEIEPFIWWQIKGGNSRFWFDNQTRCGDLYYLEWVLAQEKEVEVRHFINEQSGDETSLKKNLSKDLVDHIITDIKLGDKEANDKAWQMASPDGNFKVKSAYDLLRYKRGVVEWANHIWMKGLPNKIAFVEDF